MHRLLAHPPRLALVCAAACVVGCAAGLPPEMTSDLILTNGAVVTEDPARPGARAVAVRGDTIAAVGSDDDIVKLAGPKTRRIDLRGAMVVPGLTDAHGHVRSFGEELANLDLHGIDSIEEIARRVRERDAILPPGAWITGHGWDQNLWPGKKFPDHRPLTAAAPGRPVWLSRVDGHASWANLKAMQVAGVTRRTADPSGGKIERDGRGEPTGVFVDNAQDLVEKARPQASRAQIKEWLGLSLQRLAEAGLTEIHDAAVTLEDVDAYRELADEGRLPLRVYLM